MSGLFGSSPKVQQQQSALSLTIQQSSYGVPITLLYGTNRVYGNLLWYGAFNAVQVAQQGAGGKGGVVGGGGKGGGSGQYQYYTSMAIALTEGVITSIGQVYVSKQISDLATLGGVLFSGEESQDPWGYLTTQFPAEAIGYTETAYVGFQNFSLGTSTETPQFSYEAFGSIVLGVGYQDCSPEQFFIDFLSRAGVDADNIGDFSSCVDYWRANGFLISPVIDQQQSALEWLQQIMMPLNAEFVWYPSQGYIDAVSYGDTPASGNGSTFIPNLTPIYVIGDDDYIRDGDEDPVTCMREDMSDVNNQVPIEYVNRADQYNVETYTAYDDALTDEFGLRIASTISAHHVTDPNIAQVMATIFMNRAIYRRNKYTFKLPWNYFLLDPMDIIAINDENMGLFDQLVQIIDISEDQNNGVLTYNVEEIPNAIAGAAQFPNFGVTRSTPNYNLNAGSINPPIFFEAPLAFLQAAEVEVDIGISSPNPKWGGCDIWVSTDGETYRYLTQFNARSRMGVLTADLASFTPSSPGNNIDVTNTLSVDMAESEGLFNNSATNQDAINLNTLCYVDGEFIAYGSDVLTGANKYDLSYLNRGCYGTTISAHASGSNFAAFDQSVFRYEADQSYVGKTLYFKFVSYNAWGGGLEDISEVSAYSYTLLGTALLTPLGNPRNLATNYFGDIAQLNWDPISDIRSPIFYEIRKGISFETAQFVGRTTQTNFRVTGSGTYFVSALYITPLGVAVYSTSAPSIAISIPTIVQNVLGTYDEAATGWSGTLSHFTISGSNIISTLGQSSAIYTAPSGHKITSAYQVSARVTMNWSVAAANPASDIVSIPDITVVPDITFASVQLNVTTQPQVRLDGGAWQNWSPGVYTFTYIEFRLIALISDTTYQAVISEFSFEVDVNDTLQTGTVTTTTGGALAVTFPYVFNTAPAVDIQIIGGSNGDEEFLTSVTTSGFSVEVLNSGSPVARTVSYKANAW